MALTSLQASELGLPSGPAGLDSSGNLAQAAQYVVTLKFANLPSSPTLGMMYLVTDGCKPGEATGAGSGVLCVYDGSNWMSVSSGTTVTT